MSTRAVVANRASRLARAREDGFATRNRRAVGRGRARTTLGRVGTDADADAERENDEDDDDDVFASASVSLTEAQAKIAAAALETMFAAEEKTSADEDAEDREEVRRRRFELILREAVRRAKASCDAHGGRSATCVSAWEEVSEVRDAASRAGVVVAGMGEGSRANGARPSSSSEETSEEQKAREREFRERLRKDPLMGSLPCERTGECTVPEGTLEARGRLMRAFESEREPERESRPAPDAKTVEEAVTRAMALCATEGATREQCAIAWEEVEALTNWGRGQRGG